MIGKTVSHYHILEKLGEGGMGVVYKAEDTKLGRTVALKFLPPELTRDPEAKQRFVQEARAASALDHPNICNVHEIDETSDGRTFIAMACYDGESLKSKIEHGPLGLDEALDIASQVAQGLAKANGQGIIHRDIKPANILVTNDGLVKIVDFGLAKLAGTKLTKTGKTLGTAQYMSPEQARGEKVDQRADIWSLGIVLYEMLTGKHAFPGEYEQATLYSIMNEEPAPVTSLRSGVPMELERVVKKMLAKSPAERYQHVDEVIADIAGLKKELAAAPTGRTPRGARAPAARRRAIAIWIPAAVLVLVLAIFLLKPQIFNSVPGSAARMSIAVIGFENQTGDPSLDNLQEAIPNLLITKLEQSKYLRVATWERLHDLVKQIGKGDMEVIDRDTGFEACMKGGINTIVTGSFARAGELFVTDVKVLDVRTKESLASKSAKGKGVESILESQIDELGRDIARAVGLSERKIEATTLPIADVTTGSMLAYECFLRGVGACNSHYWEVAVRALEKAVALDSNFAMAYRHLGDAYGYLGHDAMSRTKYDKALLLARTPGKTTERESLEIEAVHAAVFEWGSEREMRIYREFVKKFPAEKRAHFGLARCLFFDGKLRKTISEYENALLLDPSYTPAMNQLSAVYSRLGEFENSLHWLQKYIEAAPGDANALDSMGELYFYFGKLDDAIARLSEAVRLKPDFGTWRSLAYTYALKEDYAMAMKCMASLLDVAPTYRAEGWLYGGLFLATSGNTAESIRHLDTASAIFDSTGSFLGKIGTAFLEAGVYYAQKEYEKSNARLETIRKLTEEQYGIGVPSRILAEYNIARAFNELKRGDLRWARKRYFEIGALIDKTKNEREKLWTPLAGRARVANAYAILESELSLAEGSVDKAIQVGKRVPPVGIPGWSLTSRSAAPILQNYPIERDVLARAYVKRGDLERAMAVYEELVTFDPGQEDRLLVLPIYHYRLATLYEAKGRVEEAIEQYQKFLLIMSKADIYQAEIADAKTRVASLTGRRAS